MRATLTVLCSVALAIGFAAEAYSQEPEPTDVTWEADEAFPEEQIIFPGTRPAGQQRRGNAEYRVDVDLEGTECVDPDDDHPLPRLRLTGVTVTITFVADESWAEPVNQNMAERLRNHELKHICA